MRGCAARSGDAALRLGEGRLDRLLLVLPQNIPSGCV